MLLWSLTHLKYSILSFRSNNAFKLILSDNNMSEKRVKMALIAGASQALEYKRRNPKASDEEAIQHVSRQADKIADKLDTN
jgi:hypothetical protein